MKPLETPMILRNFRQLKVDKDGRYRNLLYHPYRINGRNMAVYAFDLYFYPSYRQYGTEYVRARDNKQARSKIKQQYPNIVRFQWDDSYRG